jgi:hypothetical protein
LSFLRPPGFEAHGSSEWTQEEEQPDATTIGLLDQTMEEDIAPDAPPLDPELEGLGLDGEFWPPGEDHEYGDELEEDVLLS